MMVRTALLVFSLLVSSKIYAVKADGYAYIEDGDFIPGVYQAINDAKVYYDTYDNSINKGLSIKRGTKVVIYSSGIGDVAERWFDLNEGKECNGNLLPWSKLGFIGVLKKDFIRVSDAAAPIYERGLITNCPVEYKSKKTTQQNSDQEKLENTWFSIMWSPFGYTCAPNDPKILLSLAKAKGIQLKTDDIEEDGEVIYTKITDREGKSSEFIRGLKRCRMVLEKVNIQEKKELDRYN